MAERSPLLSTLAPFDWRATRSDAKQTAVEFWRLVWDLLKEQQVRLGEDGIVPRDRFSDEGSIWTAAVDLDLTHSSSVGWFGGEQFCPHRSVGAPATASSVARLSPGTPLRLEAVIPDRYLEGMGTNYWSLRPVDQPHLDVTWIASALEGRWGGSAVLGDNLIVAIDHPIVGDVERADRLVRDLQQIAHIPTQRGTARRRST